MLIKNGYCKKYHQFIQINLFKSLTKLKKLKTRFLAGLFF